MSDAPVSLARLTRNQKNVICDLDDQNFIFFGCAEDVAKRLAKSSGNRPALLEQRQGERWPEFRLNALGLQTKHAILQAKEDVQ